MAARKFPDKELIKKYYNEGLNSVEISRKLNISPVSIRYHLNKIGLTCQSREEAARLYGVNHDFFKEINSSEKAYILGILSADGCNYRGKETTVILELIDKEIIFKINSLISPKKPVIHKKRETSDTWRLNIKSKIISNDLLAWGIVPKKSLELQFPLNIEHRYLSHYIRGYFDGDGGVHINNKRAVISFTGTKHFLSYLTHILKKECNVNDNKIIKNCKSNICNINYAAKKDILSIYDFIYHNNNEMFIKRKKYKLNEWKLRNNYR